MALGSKSPALSSEAATSNPQSPDYLAGVRHPRALWLWLCAAALVSPVGALMFGAAELSAATIYTCVFSGCADPIDGVIFWEIRMPRIFVGFLVGAGLAIAGATLQNVTRNSLADPYLFGVVSGAGLGASVASLLFAGELDARWGIPSDAFSIALPAAAFIGAIAAVCLVQVIAKTALGRNTEHMLLAGVAVSLMLGACSQFLLFAGEPFAANQVIFWLMGSLARVETWYGWAMLVAVLLSTGLLWLYGPRIDALLMGDDSAQNLGINVGQLRLMCLLICAFLTACIVCYCGGIGFVGLMIPHIVRHWFGVTSRVLFAGCLLLGGCFMVWVDVLARVAVEGQEIPIGVITSAIGSVFFILVMSRRQS